jgi:DNA-binding MarR family transcriptional regulator
LAQTTKLGSDGLSARERSMRRLGEEIRANQRATDKVDELVAELLGVNRTDSRALDILEQHGRMSAGHLALSSGLSSGAVTAVVDRLERAGYARRVPDASDRRRVLIELTDKARELIWELMGRPMREAGRPLIDRYSDAELELLIDFQRRGREMQERHAEWLRDRLRAHRLPRA